MLNEQVCTPPTLIENRFNYNEDLVHARCLDS